ncbi:hypothetical protein BWQ96_03482 [Gracilariopsis chorda]|uniref:Uncharacterized protein n=1 Tax=Gracilariopsis chorda TaxID=448386 RepID=A0A2V3IXF4_9FLOR|nr:hypothetical protein BWQ96_03482 [Gracilariopsis chorda]|eukprot:PXF46791.1 hypothetical protein BWQ96_03482 [Gracilariopsis chorda]
MSHLEYFPCYDPMFSDAPAHFDYPNYRTYHMARSYIKVYAQQFGHSSTDYTTGFTRKIQADDAADVEASFNELKSGQMIGKQGFGATTTTNIFCLSYSSTLLEDRNYSLSRDDWRRALEIAAQTGNACRTMG